MRSLFVVVPLIVLACSPTKPANPAPVAHSPFSSEHVSGLGDPELIIENDSDVPCTIELTGASPTSLELPPHQKRTLRVKAGQYSYSGRSPGIVPIEGGQLFAADTRYLWRFFVKTVRSDDPVFVGKGWTCFDVKANPDFMICGRNQTSCDKARAVMEKPGNPPFSTCAPYQLVYGFNDSADDIPFYAKTAEQCEAFRAAYLKEAKDVAKVTPCSEKK